MAIFSYDSDINICGISQTVLLTSLRTKDVAKDVGKLAAQDRETAYHYINKKLSPYLLGKNKSAVDYYLYMVTRWDPSIDKLLSDKSSLDKFIAQMKEDDAVKKVLSSHNL